MSRHATKSIAAMRGLVLCAGLICAPCCVATAQTPLTLDYQVMLTDDSDQPLADQTVTLAFRIYEADTGGASLWSETHVVTTNSIGVASVILGSTNPMDILFSGQLWLQIEVDGQAMAPRRQLAAAPYAHFSRVCELAVNSDYLGGEPAAAYVTSETLSAPGDINLPGNPVDWSKLKGVPEGFADGADDAGEGDGNSLDAAGGGAEDVIRVEHDATVRIGTGEEETFPPSNIYVSGRDDGCAAFLDGYSSEPFEAALIGRCPSNSAVVGNAGTGMYALALPANPAAVAGFAQGGADGAYFDAEGGGDALLCKAWDVGAAVRATAHGTGSSGFFEGGAGVDVESDATFPVLDVDNTRVSGYGDAGWFASLPGVSSDTWALNASCYEGNAGRFAKGTDDNEYALKILGVNSASEGLYVSGTIFSTGTVARSVETSRGTEPVYGICSPDVELILRGRGRLDAGSARIDFDRTFAESILGSSDTVVTVTPIGRWSAIYVRSIDDSGFDVRSDAGDPNVEFHWVAVGRADDHRERPQVTIPDPEEEARLAEQKLELREAMRAPRREMPGRITRIRP